MPTSCDPETGVCKLPDADADIHGVAPARDIMVSYVGDPMCSWCRDIAPTLHGLAGYCQRHDLDFAITAGGL